MPVLTNKQMEAQDVLYAVSMRAVNDVLNYHNHNNLEWDMEWMGEIADVIVRIIIARTNLTEMDIYPYYDEEE